MFSDQARCGTATKKNVATQALRARDSKTRPHLRNVTFQQFVFADLRPRRLRQKQLNKPTCQEQVAGFQKPMHRRKSPRYLGLRTGWSWCCECPVWRPDNNSKASCNLQSIDKLKMLIMRQHQLVPHAGECYSKQYELKKTRTTKLIV